MRVRSSAGSAARVRVAPAEAPASRPGTYAARAPAPAGVPVDVASIAGIPEPDLTPGVRAAVGRLMAEVRDLREELGLAHQRIAYLEDLADRDDLAPVLNRRAFVRELARMISFAERYGVPGSVLYFDVDDMKRINDGHGHGAGDAVLKRVAEALLAHLRGSDAVGRLGGDEFGVILAKADQQAAAVKAAALVQEIRAEPVRWNGIRLNVAVSFGVYTFAGGEQVYEALNAADQAMYAHKRRAGLAARPG
ncbi:MAG: GGDEF domain-containing protein [Kiloniellaceae bacterium]